MGRGIEAVKGDALGCVVIGDHPAHGWTHNVQRVTQRLLLESGFRIAEMLPQFHRYHLDDDPDLTSCSLIAQRRGAASVPYGSKVLDPEKLHNFYGSENPLRIHYIRDLRNGGKFESHDIKTEPFDGNNDSQTEASQQVLVYEGGESRG
jgi:hypothetical protein